MSGASLRLLALAFVLANVGCVATDGIAPEELPVCAERRSDDPSDAVVRVFVEGPEFVMRCNGVLIAPNLVLTATSCLTQRVGEADFNVPRCLGTTGAPLESGSFEARYLGLAERASISLKRGNESLESTIEAVFVSEAASACLPDIAILAIQPALDLPTITLRLEGTSQVGDVVTLNGYDISEGTPAQHSTPVDVVEVTSYNGTDRLPPRSLRLSGRACTGEGGAVLARETNALVGLVVASSLTINCDADGEGPLAVQIAPFREFILETARLTDARVISELRDGPSSIPRCSP